MESEKMLIGTRVVAMGYPQLPPQQLLKTQVLKCVILSSHRVSWEKNKEGAISQPQIP